VFGLVVVLRTGSQTGPPWGPHEFSAFSAGFAGCPTLCHNRCLREASRQPRLRRGCSSWVTPLHGTLLSKGSQGENRHRSLTQWRGNLSSSMRTPFVLPPPKIRKSKLYSLESRLRPNIATHLSRPLKVTDDMEYSSARLFAARWWQAL